MNMKRDVFHLYTAVLYCGSQDFITGIFIQNCFGLLDPCHMLHAHRASTALTAS